MKTVKEQIESNITDITELQEQTESNITDITELQEQTESNITDITELKEQIADLQEQVENSQEQETVDDICDKIYPIGSIYMSVSSTSPESLFGGTWEQIQDTFLLSAGSTYTAGDTGGEATHTLTTSEMPSHSHSGVVTNVTVTTTSTANLTYVGTAVTAVSQTTGSTAKTGSGTSFSIMPPYLVVYMWQRTA